MYSAAFAASLQKISDAHLQNMNTQNCVLKPFGQFWTLSRQVSELFEFKPLAYDYANIDPRQVFRLQTAIKRRYASALSAGLVV